MFSISNFYPSSIWKVEYFGNTLENLATSLLVMLGLLLVFAIFQQIVLWRLKNLAEKTETDIDDAMVRIVQSVRPPFYFFIAFYLSFTFLDSSEFARQAMRSTVIAFITYQVVQAAHVFVDYIVEKYSKSQSSKGETTAIATLGSIIKLSFWFIGALVVLQNLGVNVTSLVAGLGIGGIAIALAAQGILADLFSSFSIIFDKPFEVGDYIQIGEQSGTVKKIGIKTTRIQALQGEEIIIGNQELTSSRIQNFGKLKERRIVFSIGVTYETPKTTLKKIPAMIRKIIKSQELAKVDRVHFKGFGDSSLNFEAAYYVESGEYVKYMNVQEKINLGIIDVFEENKIDMAYPTQTVYLKKTG